jgi:hypothetical protein
MRELQNMRSADIPAALALAERCRANAEPEVAESICLDILTADPNQRDALRLLLFVRTDLFGSARPGALERARELLPRFESAYDRAYFEAIICERQARHLLRQRGRRAGHIAYDWFSAAIDQYAEATRIDPAQPEPDLRRNACIRSIEAHPECEPGREEAPVHEIE